MPPNMLGVSCVGLGLHVAIAFHELLFALLSWTYRFSLDSRATPVRRQMVLLTAPRPAYRKDVATARDA